MSDSAGGAGSAEDAIVVSGASAPGNGDSSLDGAGLVAYHKQQVAEAAEVEQRTGVKVAKLQAHLDGAQAALATAQQQAAQAQQKLDETRGGQQ